MHNYDEEPRISDQLVPELSDHVLEIHDHFYGVTLDEIASRMPEPITTEYGRAVILEPAGEPDEHTVVLSLPHQEGWTPITALSAMFMQQAVAPDSRMVVLPNNTAGEQYYQLDPQVLEQIKIGDMAPFYHNQARIVESLVTSGSVDLTGYGLGGLTSVGIALMAKQLDIRLVNADETPNLIRKPQDLQHNVRSLMTIINRSKAFGDTALLALDEIADWPYQIADYRNYERAAKVPENAALYQGMARQALSELVFDFVDTRPEILLKFGRVVDSSVVHAGMYNTMSEQSQYIGSNEHYMEYSSDYSRKHATGANPVALAMMYKQATRLATELTID
jgi:hypothetical protein